ncbi:MAG: response regulator, partial [Pseudomonadota bacterium]|nr:response regulator [Pseudomonadota bacterium]
VVKVGMTNPLHTFKVLIADADQHLSLVLRQMLNKMGFTNVEMTRSGQKAMSLLKQAPYDFVITDWNLKDADGLSLINHIRRDPASANISLPIIMLTGQAEESDVLLARDRGVNEYVVKPFSARAIYNRLERIVESPRNFIVAGDFVGPDRRNKSTPPEGVPERRTARVAPTLPPHDTAAKSQGGRSKIWLPDKRLKKKLGHSVTLDSLITPAVLKEAQATIDAISTDSLQWIKADLRELVSLQHAIATDRNPALLVDAMAELALLISSRAGTFGYNGASEVAYHLYLFCRNKLNPANPNHHTIVAKHVEVLQVIFGSGMQASGDVSPIVIELKNLTRKYAS